MSAEQLLRGVAGMGGGIGDAVAGLLAERDALAGPGPVAPTPPDTLPPLPWEARDSRVLDGDGTELFLVHNVDRWEQDYVAAWIVAVVNGAALAAPTPPPAEPGPDAMVWTAGGPDRADDWLVKAVIAASGGQEHLDGPSADALTRRITINALRECLDARRRGSLAVDDEAAREMHPAEPRRYHCDCGRALPCRHCPDPS